MEGKIFDKDTQTAENVTYEVFELDSGINSWVSKGTKPDATAPPDIISNTFEIGDAAASLRDFNIKVSSVPVINEVNGKDEATNLNLKVKVENDYVYIYTNGINKGNIIPFELQTKVNNVFQTEETKKFFNGPKNFTIKPVHLDGSLNSVELIENITQMTPGSKPGIKIAFDAIKVLKDGEFQKAEKVNDVENVMIKVEPQYSANTGQGIDQSIRLDFKPIHNQPITIDTTTQGPTVKADGNQVEIYLAKDVDGIEGKAIKWDLLDSSMVLDTLMTYGKSAITYHTASTNKGHTYIEYSLNKTVDGEVQFTIKPYNINSSATYKIYSANSPDSEFSEKMSVQYDPNTTNNKEITAVVTSTNTTYFKIQIDIDGKIYTSQTVKFVPTDFVAVPITPTIKTIDNIYVTPKEADSNSASAIGFNIEWNAPSNLKNILATGDLYYEMLVRRNKDDKDPMKTPENAGKEGYAAYSKVFKVTLDGVGDDAKIVVLPEVGNAGSDEVEATARYKENSGTFKMEDVVLKNYSEESNDWEQIIFPKDYNYATVNGTNYLSGIKTDNTLTGMTVPGNYYVSMRTVFVPKDTTKNATYSNESNLKSVAIDIAKEIIPIPTVVDFEDKTEDIGNIVEKMTFNYVNIVHYVDKMITPSGLKLYQGSDSSKKYSGNYVFYLYKDESAMKAVDLDRVPTIDIEEGSTLNLKEKKVNQTSALTMLREGGVVGIRIPIDALMGAGSGLLEMEGLDPNEIYYMQVRTELATYDITTNDYVATRYSGLSKVFTFTTTTELTGPSPEDKVPPSPEKIWIVNQENNSSVTLGWAPADFEEDDDIDKTYYEFIRTQKQLSKDDMSKTIKDLVKLDSKNVGFSSFNPESKDYDALDYMYTYRNGAWTQLEPQQVSNKFELFDDSLDPNTIYYYYVRTVCIINGTPVNSQWIMVPVTTEPVAPPINLKVETEKAYSHDVKTEVVISFDAPVPSGASIPADYEFDIAVKEGDEEAYSLDYSNVQITSSTDHEGTPEGYTHFVYKIKKLNPNSKYYIKVRIKDKTKELTNGGSYPTSLYCDYVTTRTEYDEEYEEQKNKYEEYLNKLDSELEKLRKRAYWVVEDGHTYKYRSSYVEAEIGANKEYDLVVEDDDSVYYYLPLSVFISANEQSTTLNIKFKDYTASIRPQTLTENNPEIADAIKRMGDNNLEDYYIGLSFKTSNYSNLINNEKALTQRMTIDMELIYLKSEDVKIESDIEVALSAAIDREKQDVVEKLEKKIYNGTIADDVLQDIIDEAIEDIEADHQKRVAKIIDNNIKKTIQINEIEKAILLVAKVDGYAANGYYYSASWVSVDVYSAMDGFAIEAFKFGTYIMTGQKDLLETVPSLAPYQSFIAKYNLTDFFTLDSYMIQTATTKEQLYGAVARIMGAQRNTDYTTFLKNKGIKGINNIGFNRAVRQDEAIYIVMQAYEKLYNKPVASIRIMNKQSVQNIGAFQPAYRNYVYAGVQLKIVNNPSSKVIPSKQMTVEETIIMLYKLQFN